MHKCNRTVYGNLHNISARVESNIETAVTHRRKLTALFYHKVMVDYPYHVSVYFLVIYNVLNKFYYPKMLLIYYPKFLFVVIYLFSQFYEKFSNESLSLKIIVIFERNRVKSSPILKNDKKNDGS